MSVFNTKNKADHTKVLAFLDPSGGPTIQRYDSLKYKQFDGLTDKQLGFFWRPEEVDIYQDSKDFKALSEHERHIFTSNLKRQILLDSVQGRAPVEAFSPIVSLPEIENWITTWTFSETIHSRSYTHIIRNVYSNPSKIFDEMLDKKMEGNAKIIKLIARDENLHLASTQALLKILKTDDPDYAKIADETEEACMKMFVEAVDQEKAWAEYLFKDGSMIGLNTELLSQYIEWIATKRMNNVNLKSPYATKSNPLPWTQKWISGAEVQVAPQETEITSYVQGGTKQDVSSDTFKGFSL